MESSTEANQIHQSVLLDHKTYDIVGILHRSLLLDHKMIVGGIQYQEKKELQMIFNEDGVEKSNLSRMRSIGDQTYTTNQEFVDGEVKDETIETTLAEDEIAAFKKDWEDNCKLPRVFFQMF